MVTVLVADDSAMQRLVISRSLRRHHRVLAASDGDEALALARAHRPDVAILDWRMPGRDGIAVCAAIRADPDLAATFVIVMTAHGDQELRRRAMAAGADGFIAKPISSRQVADLIGVALATTRRPAAS